MNENTTDIIQSVLKVKLDEAHKIIQGKKFFSLQWQQLVCRDFHPDKQNEVRQAVKQAIQGTEQHDSAEILIALLWLMPYYWQTIFEEITNYSNLLKASSLEERLYLYAVTNNELDEAAIKAVLPSESNAYEAFTSYNPNHETLWSLNKVKAFLTQLGIHQPQKPPTPFQDFSKEANEQRTNIPQKYFTQKALQTLINDIDAKDSLRLLQILFPRDGVRYPKSVSDCITPETALVFLQKINSYLKSSSSTISSNDARYMCGITMLWIKAGEQRIKQTPLDQIIRQFPYLACA